MAVIVWRGDAQAIAQVSEAEIDGYDASTTYGVTINGKTVSVIADTDAATTIENLIIALNASEAGEFSEITWAEGSTATHVKGTAGTAGTPFIAASFTSGGAGTMDPTTTNTLTAVTANSSPNDAGDASNYVGGVLPTTGDTLWVQDSTSSLLWNLDALTGDTLAAAHVTASFTGEIGLAFYNETGGSQYVEYRPRYLKVGITALTIGEKSGDGSARLQFDFESIDAAVECRFTDSSAEDNEFGAVEIINAGTNSTLQMTSGSLDIAPRDDDVATFATIIVDGGTVRAGATVTNPVVTVNNGTFQTKSNITTLTQNSGTVNILDTAAVATAVLNGGNCVILSSGTLGTVTMDLNAPFLDFSQDGKSRTVTNMALNRGSFSDPNQTVTWTNGIQPQRGLQAIA